MPANNHFNPTLKKGQNIGVVSEILEQPGPRPEPAKIGRPKGRAKTKKTFYLTNGVATIKEIKLVMAKNHNFTFNDDSEIGDLAIALLLKTINDPERAQEVVRLYNLEIKEQ